MRVSDIGRSFGGTRLGYHLGQEATSTRDYSSSMGRPYIVQVVSSTGSPIPGAHIEGRMTYLPYGKTQYETMVTDKDVTNAQGRAAVAVQGGGIRKDTGGPMSLVHLTAHPADYAAPATTAFNAVFDSATAPGVSAREIERLKADINVRPDFVFVLTKFGEPVPPKPIAEDLAKAARDANEKAIASKNLNDIRAAQSAVALALAQSEAEGDVSVSFEMNHLMITLAEFESAVLKAADEVAKQKAADEAAAKSKAAEEAAAKAGKAADVKLLTYAGIGVGAIILLALLRR